MCRLSSLYADCLTEQQPRWMLGSFEARPIHDAIDGNGANESETGTEVSSSDPAEEKSE